MGGYGLILGAEAPSIKWGLRVRLFKPQREGRRPLWSMRERATRFSGFVRIAGIPERPLNVRSSPKLTFIRRRHEIHHC